VVPADLVAAVGDDDGVAEVDLAVPVLAGDEHEPAGQR
jgi:hypothetical protein